MTTILVLEDDRVFLRLVVEALEKRGHRVLQATRASDADRLLQGEDPDLLVVDGLLPDITGVQWVEKSGLRGARRRSCSSPRSGRACAPSPWRPRSFVPIRLIHKPLEPDDLADRVATALEEAAKPPQRSRRK